MVLLTARSCSRGRRGRRGRRARRIGCRFCFGVFHDIKITGIDLCRDSEWSCGECSNTYEHEAIEALNAVVPGGIFPSGTTADQFCSDLCSQSCYGAGGLAMWIKGPCITEYAPVA